MHTHIHKTKGVVKNYEKNLSKKSSSIETSITSPQWNFLSSSVVVVFVDSNVVNWLSFHFHTIKHDTHIYIKAEKTHFLLELVCIHNIIIILLLFFLYNFSRVSFAYIPSMGSYRINRMTIYYSLNLCEKFESSLSITQNMQHE